MDSDPPLEKDTGPTTGPTRVRSFGRRRGRPLRQPQQHALDTILPDITIQGPVALKAPAKGEGEQATGNDGRTREITTCHRLTQAELISQFPDSPSEIWLEIGFGGGEHMIAQSQKHMCQQTRIGYIGSEPYINGVAKVASAVHRKALTSIRLWPDDVRFLIDMLPDSCLNRVYILFPDPWPKAKHTKRRLITTDLLYDLARILKPQGYLRIATDDPSYQIWIMQRLVQNRLFLWQLDLKQDWKHPWPDHVPTRYEQKALEAGRKPQYYCLRRV